MSRSRREYNCNEQVEMVMSKINAYLSSRGYTYKDYDGEMLYHIGNGWVSPPRCIKVFREQNKIIVEGWLKYVLLPYVAIGEFDIFSNSLVGVAFKKSMREDFNTIEKIIGQTQGASYESQYAWQSQWGSKNSEESGGMPNNANPPIESQFNNVQSGSDIDTNNSFSALTKKEYIEKYAPSKLKGDLKKAVITGYVCSGISAIAGIAIANPAVIIEMLIMIGLLLGMHLGKSKICAIIYLCVACLDCIIGIATTGRPSGWLVIIAGILAVRTLAELDRQYSDFVKSGTVDAQVQTKEWNF